MAIVKNRIIEFCVDVIETTIEEFWRIWSSRFQLINLQDRMLKFALKNVTAVHIPNMGTVMLVLMAMTFYIIVRMMLMQ